MAGEKMKKIYGISKLPTVPELLKPTGNTQLRDFRFSAFFFSFLFFTILEFPAGRNSVCDFLFFSLFFQLIFPAFLFASKNASSISEVEYSSTNKYLLSTFCLR